MLKKPTFLVLSIMSLIATNSHAQNQPNPPKKDQILETHGHQRVDPYYWMNERDSKEVLAAIEDENKYAKDYFKPLKKLQKTLLDEFENRIDPNEQSAPFVMNGITYQIRQRKGKDYAYLYILNGGKDSLFFDENERAKGHKFYDLGDWNPSPNGQLLAVGEDFIGRRNYTLSFRNNQTGSYEKDQVENTDGSVIWANDNATVFYVRKDPTTLREFQVWRHKLGTPTSKDELVFEEMDERFYVYISKSMNKKYVQISSYSSLTSELRFISADQPTEAPQVFLERKDGHLYAVECHDNGFYVSSNLNAKNKQILFTPRMPKHLDECVVIQAHNPEVLIENVLVYKNHLVIEEREKGLTRIKCIELATNSYEHISFPEETYNLSFAYNDDYEGETLNYSYNSMTTPPSIYRFDLKAKTRVLFHQKKLIDENFRPENYRSERIWAVANDGTLIPVSMVYHKDTDLTKAPLLLYGYGSYGITIPDVFSATRLSLLDRGFVFAVAHIRGGKYMGESWYDDGKFLKKKNTFTDFINCAEYLALHGKCDPNRIYAQGGSAGGLLMGAIVNMAPHLWKGIVSQVPFVDVVTTMLDETIPLTVGEFEEWGNPKDLVYYNYLLSYSPYDNLKEAHYPSILVTTGYHDSQVQYWEPLKYVSKLRTMKLDSNPLIFDCNMDAGHGGGSGRSVERKEIAQVYAFLLNLEGIEK